LTQEAQALKAHLLNQYQDDPYHYQIEAFFVVVVCTHHHLVLQEDLYHQTLVLFESALSLDTVDFYQMEISG
jgi:hypothetical protein